MTYCAKYIRKFWFADGIECLQEVKIAISLFSVFTCIMSFIVLISTRLYTVGIKGNLK